MRYFDSDVMEWRDLLEKAKINVVKVEQGRKYMVFLKAFDKDPVWFWPKWKEAVERTPDISHLYNYHLTEFV